MPYACSTGNPGRVELRAANSACNPYLGMALCLAAGLEGVEQQLELPPPNTANLFSETDGMSAKQMAAHGVGRLPQNLAEAVAVTDTPCAPESISPSASPMVMVMVMVMRPSSQAVCLCLCLLPRSLAPPSRLCGVLIADGRRGHGASDG